ncbi:MAG: biotin--[acetyl-CoA-carboxylase] ligase [Candidatus Omnitrophica bacterium]|nr:biotin--[acetyl-CoA-carboxylase] ligase [Candidatus Omnitrophota bacterium]
MKISARQYLKIINLKKVDSTNTYATKLAQKGAQEITVVTAVEQTEGRGRLGRRWVSPKDKGIYASFILKPPNPIEDLYYLPLTMSLAVARVLSKIIKSVKIKMPNDILVQTHNNLFKKVGGVLVEVKSAAKRIDFAIVGIGININSQEQDLPKTATSLYIETKKRYNIKDLLNQLIAEVMDLYSKFKEQDFKQIFEELYRYQQKSFKKIDIWKEIPKDYPQAICFL